MSLSDQFLRRRPCRLCYFDISQGTASIATPRFETAEAWTRRPRVRNRRRAAPHGDWRRCWSGPDTCLRGDLPFTMEEAFLEKATFKGQCRICAPATVPGDHALRAGKTRGLCERVGRKSSRAALVTGALEVERREKADWRPQLESLAPRMLMPTRH